VWEDTLADRVVRFAVGALLGGLLGCRSFHWIPEGSRQGDLVQWAWILGPAAVVGLLAVLFGYRFLGWLMGARD
jgi:hypothetical protein